ncbi:Membrane protein containing Zn-ribbon domain [Halapricum desulfuricans]|uniref:Membrane protein containing Zn-ribbon domain n=1 Tax=Halapricum desulfuricans TaxID=2841257 RepID=A0A897NIV3_9EURY|nr:zinc ribbon domain-containing protein [Halapricum desulfuricans]QSG10893.1 Membrane protein containing Zn-ribbon domain [Halapricum desulfuricans]
MAERRIDFRPWIAAFLGSLVAGLGHLYLRRIRRAIGWLVAVVLAAMIWVLDPGNLTLLEIAPSVVVLSLSVFDAFSIALREQRPAQSKSETLECPACGGSLDPELDFCPWCTTRFEHFEVRDIEE